jgi:homoserine/homoserine lactone efflux protein
MSLHDWLIFVAVWTAAGIPLGPNAMNCIVISISGGFCRGLWAVLGVTVAAMCHMAAAGLGLSTLLLANASLFAVVKWFGVAYLAWLGVSTILKREAPLALGNGQKVPALAAFRRGFMTSMTNPKAILVYIALFPQFIRPEEDPVPQLAMLVPTALVIVVVIYAAYCALGLGVRRLLSTARRRRIFNGGVGGFYLFGAVGLACFNRQNP